jgi:hypothetical protein
MAELLSEVKVRATQRSTKNHGPPKADERRRKRLKTKKIGSAITAMRRRRKRDRDSRTGRADRAGGRPLGDRAAEDRLIGISSIKRVIC